MRRRISVYVGRRCGDGKSRLPDSRREESREREEAERMGKRPRERERERVCVCERGWWEEGGEIANGVRMKERVKETEWIMIQSTLAATTLLESTSDKRNERENGTGKKRETERGGEREREREMVEGVKERRTACILKRHFMVTAESPRLRVGCTGNDHRAPSAIARIVRTALAF